VTVVTQNVDMFHQAAGSKTVIEMHGNKSEAICLDCNKVFSIGAIGLDELPKNAVPKCMSCSGMLKPNCVSFEQDLDGCLLARCVDLMKQCDTIVIVGTSAVVSPARELPFLAKCHGAKVIVINPQATDHCDAADITLYGSASVLVDIIRLTGAPDRT